MKRLSILLMIGFTAAVFAGKPNVVLIVCDDLNDYITGIPGETGHPQSITPNVEKLAASGVAFRRAYSNNPVCAPSRTSFLTGIYGHHSDGNVWPTWYKLPVLRNSKSLMQHFRENGYDVVGSGKLMHHLKKDEWSSFKYGPDYGPFAYDGKKNVAHTDVPMPFAGIGSIDGSYGPLDTLAFIDDGDPGAGWVGRQPWEWSQHPVSLIDLYPTLADLCGLEGDTKKNENGHDLDGFSVRPFLENPVGGAWEGPDGALSTIKGEHWSCRTKRWRYIHYKNGEDELYDNEKDPYEWTNLARKPEYALQKQQLYTKLKNLTGMNLQP